MMTSEENRRRILIGRLRESKRGSSARMHGLHFKRQLEMLSVREEREYWNLRDILPLEEDRLLVEISPGGNLRRLTEA